MPRSLKGGGRQVADRMFDTDSFLDEIQTPEEAKACVDFLTANERIFRRQLMDEGLSHEQEEQEVKAVWTNLIKSCRRVGYKDPWVDEKAKRYGVG
jgi:hypothetical protein